MAIPLESLIAAAWRERDPHREAHQRGVPLNPLETTLWGYSVTPPFPREWPCSAAAVFTWHVYATGRDFRIADGAPVAAPWAFVEIGADGAPRLETLTDSIHGIDIQSFWPLRPEEAADFALRDAAENSMLALRAPPTNEEAVILRRYYGIWTRCNGQIVREIRRFHEAFFSWLAAP